MFNLFSSLPNEIWSHAMFAQTFLECSRNGEAVDCGTLLSPLTMFADTAGFFGYIVGVIAIFWIIYLPILIYQIIVGWKIYQKAGQPGWASIIPIYNIIVLLDIVGKPRWWIILLFIPFVNIYFSVVVIHNLSLVFGKDAGFTVGLIFLGIIFLSILAFGKSTYQKPALINSNPIQAI